MECKELELFYRKEDSFPSCSKRCSVQPTVLFSFLFWIDSEKFRSGVTLSSYLISSGMQRQVISLLLQLQGWPRDIG